MIDTLLGLTPRRAVTNVNPLENPALSLHAPATWDALTGGSDTDAGVKMSHPLALTYAPVWQAVSLISADVGSTPLNVYKRLEDDDREIDFKHAAYFLCAEKANREKSAYYFWRDLMVHALIWGNGYAVIIRRGGTGRNMTPIELINLLPDRTGPEYRDGELIYVTETSGRDGQTPELIELFREDVIHVRGPSLDCIEGLDLLLQARQQWALGLAGQKFASKFFKNGGRTGGVLQLPAGSSKTARDKVEEGFRKAYENVDEAFKVVFLRDGYRFEASQATPQQGQMTESREGEVRNVARWFNLPPSKLGIKDSISYNSLEQDNLNYVTGCLRHWFAAVISECKCKLLREKEQAERTHYFDYNTIKLIEPDVKTLNEVLEIQRRNEIISANEWRRKANLNKRKDPGGEEYINPNTKSAALEREEPDDKPGQPPEKPKPNNAHRVLLSDAVGRMARRITHAAKTEAKDPAKFVAFVDRLRDGYRADFAKSLEPAVAACLASAGDERPANAVANLLVSVLVSDAHFCLDAITKPPCSASDLESNVKAACHEIETTRAERTCEYFWEGIL